MAEALYRKYRPQVFEDVVGQEPIERTLKNALRADKVSHAYLFCGPRGTGKTTTARLLAKALLCETGPTPDPDGTCEDCRLIAEGAHPDVYELDAASRTGVENVREEIISRVHFAPTRGRCKVYIVDEVHMLSTAAFNALLKTLEEPPDHVVFILCTTDPQKVPDTIHSRCQRFDFHRIAPESMVARLGAICVSEGVEFEGEALDLIAQRAEGGLRNALTSLEQIIAFENGKVTLAGAERLLGAIDSNDLAEIMASIGRRDIASCFRWTARYVETGADLALFTRDMAEHVRNLYLMALVGDDVELDVSETTRRELSGELAWFGPDRASRMLGVLGDLMVELKTTSNPRLTFEIALTRLVRPDSDLTLEAIAERVEALESGYAATAHVLPGPASGGASEPASEPVAPEPAASDDTGGVESAPAATRATPAVAPVAESAPRSTLLENPAALQRIWQAALSTVKKEKQAYGVLFMNTKAFYDKASDMLEVRFSPESTFAFGAVQKPDVQDVLARALEKAAGEPVAFCYAQGGDAPASASESAPASDRGPSLSTASEPAPEPSPAPAPEPVPAPEPAPAPDFYPYEDVPYEPVPYDEMPYDLAPRDEAPRDDSRDDATASATPAGPELAPDGTVREDPAAVQALLQASFGGGVVLSETDE